MLKREVVKVMLVSHVGSFPLDPSPGIEEKILEDLYKIGVDVPPYPQLRSFIDIYLEPLANIGLLEKKGDFYYSNIDKLLETEPPRLKVPEAELSIRIVREKKLGFKGLRAPVTGPYTLASRVYFDDPEKGLRATMVSKPIVVKTFFVEYVKGFVEYMRDLGYNTIFIDEPILGVIVGKRRILYRHTVDSIIENLETLYSMKGETNIGGIHVCGRISDKLFEILSQVKGLRLLNFEFKDSPENINVVSYELLEKYDKILAPGVASAKRPVVESVDEISALLEKIYELTRGRIDYVSADCGFGGLKGAFDNPYRAYEVGLRKLENIVRTVRKISK